MNIRKTDINKVREQTILLAHSVPIKRGDFGIVTHPFTSFEVFPTISKDDNSTILLNLLNEKDRNEWFKILEKRILSSNLTGIFLLLNNPYKLVWIKFCKPFLSDYDFAKLLSSAWVDSENPNNDINVPLNEILGWFKNLPKEYLMSKNDLDVYQNIANKITLYRGVGKKSNPYGSSYTSSKENAEWFLNRFDDKGSLITLEVNKKDILAYFSSRNEDEYIIDTNGYRKQIKFQIMF